MNNNNEIKKANRKAMPKFILFMVICSIVGGVAGFFSSKYGLDSLAGGIKAAGESFGTHIAPWLLLAIAIIMPIISVPLYKRAKKLLATWDGEDDNVSDDVDEKLSIIIWITGAAFIISLFLIAASYSGGFAIFDNEENTVPFFVSIAAFLAVIFESIILNQKCVDTVKKTNPEKTASVYDMRFQKKWIDSCDEAEKIIIGKCAFKAYLATNTVCPILAMLLAICALIFNIGFLPSLVVCVIWIVNHTAYCKESMKYSKSGNKIL